jgi:methylmalonyl-CoA mutase
MQRVDLPDSRNRQRNAILDDLNNAAEASCSCSRAVGDYGYALPATEAAIEATSGRASTPASPPQLDFGPPSRQAATLVASYVTAKGLAPGSVNIRFGFDPFGAMATRGVAPKP